MERINAWTTYTEAEERQVMDLARAYRTFLDAGKTERECTREAILRAKAAGYVDLEEAAACADLVKAKHNIPYHVGGSGGEFNFDRSRAEQFPAKNRMIIEPGEEITIQ